MKLADLDKASKLAFELHRKKKKLHSLRRNLELRMMPICDVHIAFPGVGGGSTFNICPSLVAAVLPCAEQSLAIQIASLEQQLRDLGVDTSDPKAINAPDESAA